MDVCWQSNVSAFNMLSRLVIAFLPRRKHLLISWLQSSSAVILEPPKIKSVTVSIVPLLFSIKWWDQMPWSYFSGYWVLSQHFHSPLHFHQNSLYFFAFCLKGGIICISEVIDISPSNILIPACDSSSLAFPMMYSVHKLNKQGENIQVWRTPLKWIKMMWYIYICGGILLSH